MIKKPSKPHWIHWNELNWMVGIVTDASPPHRAIKPGIATLVKNPSTQQNPENVGGAIANVSWSFMETWVWWPCQWPAQVRGLNSRLGPTLFKTPAEHLHVKSSKHQLGANFQDVYWLTSWHCPWSLRPHLHLLRPGLRSRTTSLGSSKQASVISSSP